MTNEDIDNSHHDHFMMNLKDVYSKKTLYNPFLWMGFNCLKATEPLRGDSLLFISKSLGVTSTHLFYFRGMKSQYILSCFYKPSKAFSHSRNLPNCLLKLNFFTHVLRQNSPPGSYYHPHISIVPPPAERGGGNYVDIQIIVKFFPTRAYFRQLPFLISVHC